MSSRAGPPGCRGGYGGRAGRVAGARLAETAWVQRLSHTCTAEAAAPRFRVNPKHPERSLPSRNYLCKLHLHSPLQVCLSGASQEPPFQASIWSLPVPEYFFLAENVPRVHKVFPEQPYHSRCSLYPVPAHRHPDASCYFSVRTHKTLLLNLFHASQLCGAQQSV